MKTVLMKTTFFLLFAAACCSAQENTVSVSADAKPVEYNRMIYGTFLEHFHRQIYGGIYKDAQSDPALLDESGFRKDVIDAMKEIKVPIVRYPGGCFVSSYHWQDGVGPNRQPSLDKAWGVEDPNTFGTVEFVRWCRKIGAEPYICTNAGTGTAEEMSDWVEYCNATSGKFARMRESHGYKEPLNVKYWSIGNENYGSWELGAKTAGEWGPLVRESAKLMKAVDPSIKLLAAATPNEGWTLPLLQAAGNRLDYVCIHGYYDNIHHTNRASDYAACMQRTGQPEGHIAAALRILDKAKLRGKVKIAFDEWNLRGWYHPNFPGGGAVGENAERLIKERDKNDINSLYTMADAVFSACFLNACLRNCNDVVIGGFAPAINTRGYLYVHPKGIVKRTTYHVFAMYVNLLEKNVLPVSVGTYPDLDLVLTCDDTKEKLVLAVVNKNADKPVDVALDIALPLLQNTVQQNAVQQNAASLNAMILSGSSVDDYNDVGRENSVVPQKAALPVKDGKITLPPHSVSVITLR